MPDFTLAELHQAVREAVRAELTDLDLPLNGRRNETDPFLTIDEVCERLSISKTTLWELRRKGKITGHTVGRRVLFREGDVNALVGGNS